MSLTTPSRAIARRLLEKVPADKALGATIMAPRRGAQGVSLPSLEAVESFLEDRSFGEIQSFGFDVDINYVDLTGLAVWLREVLGDEELAEAAAVIALDDRAFGLAVSDVKRLLAERIDQCREVLGVLERPDGKATEPASLEGIS